MSKSSALKLGVVMLALAAAAVWVAAQIYEYGRQSVLSEIALQQAALDEVAEQTRTTDKAVEETIVVEYVDRVERVYIKGETITKEIPVYVNQANDAACTVNLGFVSVYDRAIASASSDPAQAQDAASGAGARSAAAGDAVHIPEWTEQPSSVQLSRVAQVNKANAQAFEKLLAMYLGLREWTQTQCYAP